MLTCLNRLYYFFSCFPFTQRTNSVTHIKKTTMMALSKLESMPTEIHLAILEQLLDISSLSALVLASPILYQAYLIDQETILTKATLRELNERVQGDIIPFVSCHWELGIQGEDSKENLQPAIMSLGKQAHTRKPHDIRLTLEHCNALLTIWAMHRQIRACHGGDQWCTCTAYPTEYCFGDWYWRKGMGVWLHPEEVEDYMYDQTPQWWVDWSRTLEVIMLV